MYIHVKSKINDEEYTFMFEREVDMFNDIVYYIGDVASKNGACISIVIDKNKEHATLESAMYRPTCDAKNSLQPHSGTILMLQGALKYICKRYTKLKYVSFDDKSMVPMSQIHVTAKRLLQGRKGWYEEWLQATPDMDVIQTRRAFSLLNSDETKCRIQQYLPITTQKSWGTAEDIAILAPKIVGPLGRSIIGTSWKISRSAILSYPVVFERVDQPLGGGGENFAKMKKRAWIIALKHHASLCKLWHKL